MELPVWYCSRNEHIVAKKVDAGEMERIYALTAGGVVLRPLRPHRWTRLMRVPFYHVVRVLTQAIGSNV